MRNLASAIFGALFVLAATAYATNEYSAKEAQNRTRACIPKDGTPTKLDVSSSASLALSQNTVYRFTCDVDVWWLTEDSVAGTAAADDSPSWKKTIEYISGGSGAQTRFFSAVDQAAAAGDCWVTECE